MIKISPEKINRLSILETTEIAFPISNITNPMKTPTNLELKIGFSLRMKMHKFLLW
jgi:hypothetical protein